MDIPFLDGDPRPHRFHRRDVEIDRPDADRASARQRHAGFAEAGEKGPEDEDGGPHRPDEVERGFRRGDLVGAEREPPAFFPPDGDAHLLEENPHRPDVHHVRDVLQHHGLGGQEGRRGGRQGGVLRAARCDGSGEARRAADEKGVHASRSLPARRHRLRTRVPLSPKIGSFR